MISRHIKRFVWLPRPFRPPNNETTPTNNDAQTNGSIKIHKPFGWNYSGGLKLLLPPERSFLGRVYRHGSNFKWPSRSGGSSEWPGHQPKNKLIELISLIMGEFWQSENDLILDASRSMMSLEPRPHTHPWDIYLQKWLFIMGCNIFGTYRGVCRMAGWYLNHGCIYGPYSSFLFRRNDLLGIFVFRMDYG